MCLSVSTRSTLKIKCIDKEKENSPLGTWLPHLRIGLCSEILVTFETWHMSPNLMNLGALIKARGAVDLLGCCGLSGFWHPAGATFSLDCHAPLFPPVCLCSPEPWCVLFPI